MRKFFISSPFHPWSDTDIVAHSPPNSIISPWCTLWLLALSSVISLRGRQSVSQSSIMSQLFNEKEFIAGMRSRVSDRNAIFHYALNNMSSFFTYWLHDGVSHYHSMLANSGDDATETQRTSFLKQQCYAAKLKWNSWVRSITQLFHSYFSYIACRLGIR